MAWSLPANLTENMATSLHWVAGFLLGGLSHRKMQERGLEPPFVAGQRWARLPGGRWCAGTLSHPSTPSNST